MCLKYAITGEYWEINYPVIWLSYAVIRDIMEKYIRCFWCERDGTRPEAVPWQPRSYTPVYAMITNSPP